MTVSEAVSAVDSLKPNAFSLQEKVSWLSEIDYQIFKEIISTHSGAPISEFDGYDESVAGDTVLLAPPPYDSLYVKYLSAQIDYYNNELARYNNSAVMFNVAYMNFFNYYNRTHRPIGSKLKAE